MDGEHDTHPDDGHQGSDEEKKDERKNGRRKIKIELIEDKSRRHITFSKRKLGIMKKVRSYHTRSLILTQCKARQNVQTHSPRLELLARALFQCAFNLKSSARE